MAFSVTKYVAMGSLCAIVFLGGFALWSVCVTLSGAVIAWGHVALMGHNHAVQHPTGGQVADLWVKEGDIVQIGAPLLRLDGHAQNVQLELTEGHLFAPTRVKGGIVSLMLDAAGPFPTTMSNLKSSIAG